MRSFIVAVSAALLVLAGAAPAAGQGAVHTSGSFPLHSFIPCLGEFVTGSLDWELVDNEHSSANGGYHRATNQNWSGSVVGDNSGTVWAIHGSHPFVVNTQGAQSTVVVEDNRLGISRGPAPNIHLSISQHFVVNANGDLTVASFSVSLTCPG